MQLLRDLRQPPVTCAQAYHIPLILFFVNFQPSLSVSNRQSSPYSFASNSRTDRYGRYSQFHNGKEICNDFNSPNGCNATHKNFSRISHICRACKASTHAAFNVQRADYQGKTTTSYSIQTVTKSVSRLQVLLHVLYQMNFRYLNLQCVFQHYLCR